MSESKKRRSEHQLTRDNHEEVEQNEQEDAKETGIRVASEDVLKQRRIVKAKRMRSDITTASEPTTPAVNPFAGFSFSTTKPAPSTTTTGDEPKTAAATTHDQQQAKEEETPAKKEDTKAAAAPSPAKSAEQQASSTSPEAKLKEASKSFSFGAANDKLSFASLTQQTPSDDTASTAATTTTSEKEPSSTTTTAETPAAATAPVSGFKFNFGAFSTLSNPLLSSSNNTSAGVTQQPFSGFTFAWPTTTPVTTATTAQTHKDDGEEGDAEDGGAAEDTSKPSTITLTEPASSGEEEEEVVFTIRAKIFALEKQEEAIPAEAAASASKGQEAEAGAWKERGVGQLRILKHKTLGSARLLMRRDGLQQVILNTLIGEATKLKKMGEKLTIVYGFEDGKPASWLLRFGNAESITDFTKKIEGLKAEYVKKKKQSPPK